MHSLQTLSLTLILVFASASAVVATTMPGVVGDGRASIYYVASTGELGIHADGNQIGLFDIESASGIFTGAAMFPPSGLGLDIDTNTRKTWAALVANGFTQNVSLGTIALQNLQPNFLLNDLTVQTGRGFGAEKDSSDLIYFVPEPTTTMLCGSALLALIGRCQRRG